VQTIPAQEVIEQATPIELAELLRGGFERVVVKKGRGSLDERVELVPHT
jgi:hypothetical protein